MVYACINDKLTAMVQFGQLYLESINVVGLRVKVIGEGLAANLELVPTGGIRLHNETK